MCPDAAEQLRQQQEVYQNSSGAQNMMQFRAKLPSFHMRDAFLSALASHQARPVSSSSLLHMLSQHVPTPPPVEG